MTRRDLIAGAAASGLGAVAAPRAAHAADASASWPLWEAYARRFLSKEGRVIDFSADDITTSEGQSYALFFALVANDRTRFDRLLAWTNENLAGGQLGEQLPAWLWGKDDGGRWGVRDPNSASDSDVWIAYTLLEAGRLWQEPGLTLIGRNLAAAAGLREVRRLRGLGSTLLPGSEGFNPSPGVYQLNASYLPLQLILRLAEAADASPWSRVARSTPAVIQGSSRNGFVLDWVAYWEQQESFRDAPLPRPEAKASYDAIRVYLWGGMLDPKTPGRDDILAAMSGMERSLLANDVPPAEVLADGRVKDPHGGVGFSAAVAPFLASLGREQAAQRQLRRVKEAFDSTTGLYGDTPKYYDQNLILFALGWTEGRFRFTPGGALRARGLS